MTAPLVTHVPFVILVILAILATLAGCGDDAMSVVDSDAGWGNDAGPIDLPTVAEPLPPAPPRLAIPPSWDCPAGWRSVSVAEGISECTPWPEGGQLDCPAGEAHFPGTAGCALVGAPCPADGWPAALPAGRPVRYVRAPGTAGDGSLTRPFGTINAAIAGATEGDVIAVASGTYDEFFVLPAGVALYGACAAETILTLTRPSPFFFSSSVFLAPTISLMPSRVTSPPIPIIAICTMCISFVCMWSHLSQCVFRGISEQIQDGTAASAHGTP